MNWASLTACLLLAGCATSPTPSTVGQLEALTIGPDHGVISIVRDRGFTGMGCTYYIAIDGAQAGEVDAGARVEIAATPGERIVTASVHGLCGGGTANVAVNVQPGRASYLRVGATQSGDIRLEPAAPGYR